ncbi:uncharacterized protein LOC132315164 isoform X1 [Cornus florida]|uniref:uncharacterized protein LOC132315164 isoform X1 n=1 Tax=Cornus florida TaxID=4283 RepID=UPI00289C5BC5|nr:uncharacterized protein LOC132315164 isoform X1 [Cornus florida]
MASPAPLLHYSPRFNLTNGHLGSSSHSSSSSATPPSSSCSSSSPCCSSIDRRQSFNWILCNSFGVKNTWKHQSFRAHAMSTTQGSFTSPRGTICEKDEPDHLLVLVHGILASPSDWTYAEAELKRRLGRNFLIHASSCNTYTKTFTGIDGAGKRLADEVMQVVKKKDSLKRISFLAHSLGGLFARYAIAVLYSPNASGHNQFDDLAISMNANPETACSSRRGLIAGLEPINFITLATPHLGVRGKKQLPILFGVPILEKLAPPIAPIFVGRTGSQLFLTDGKPDKPPLLLRMASDCEDGQFISALGAFRCRVLYANVSYDHMVGWRTSSVRRETELVKPPRRSLDGYKHVVDVEYCPPVSSEGPHFPPEAAKAKEAAQKTPNPQNTVEYHEIMEEEMIRGLQQLGWKKVDVSFHSAFWPFFAHNNIHVKSEWLHNAGAGVIAHVADSLKQQEKQQESSSFIAASL